MLQEFIWFWAEETKSMRSVSIRTTQAESKVYLKTQVHWNSKVQLLWGCKGSASPKRRVAALVIGGAKGVHPQSQGVQGGRSTHVRGCTHYLHPQICTNQGAPPNCTNKCSTPEGCNRGTMEKILRLWEEDNCLALCYLHSPINDIIRFLKRSVVWLQGEEFQWQVKWLKNVSHRPYVIDHTS